MGTTTKLAFRYPALADAPNGPQAFQNLAEDVENAFSPATAQYSAATTPAQSIAHGTATVVAFGTADTTSTLVTRATNGAGHAFTLLRAGTWGIRATVRFLGSANAREMLIGIESSVGTLYASSGVPSNLNIVTTLNVGVLRGFAINDVVRVTAYQNSGGALALDPGTPGWVRVNLAWLHP